jgi:hypothetical protein
MTYTIMVSVPAETDRYITYITTYPSSGAVRLTLYGQHCIRYENVFTSCERGHKTFLGPHTLGAWS